MKIKLQKIPLICLICVLLFSLLVLPSLGLEPEATEPGVSLLGETTDLGTTSEAVSPARGLPSASSEAASEEEVTVSDRIVTWMGEQIGEIFCILTFIGSLLLAWLYKKGLLPALSGSLSAISGSVKNGITSLSGAAESLSVSTEKTLSAFADEIKPVLSRVSAAAEGAENVAGALSALEGQLSAANDDRTLLKTVLRGQMELFYGFFMAVNLPQYQKDKLGEAYGRLTAAIDGGKNESL